MTYVKTNLPTLKTHVVNLKRDAKDLSRDLQRLEVRGKLDLNSLVTKAKTRRDSASPICPCSLVTSVYTLKVKLE